MNLLKQLKKHQDKEYGKFQAKIINNIDSKTILGVRTPDLKQIAKELYKSGEYEEFLNQLPHQYFEENQIHMFILAKLKDYDATIAYLNKFLPYVDNWATCDQASFKELAKYKKELLKEINKWLKSKETYTIRFAIGLLLAFYLDEDFDPKYLKLVSKIRSQEYYVNMMIAWYFATALAKQYESTIVYFEKQTLDDFCHNKAIQKAIESYRIDNKTKDYLRTLKVK